jgi:hypothetical protein
MIYLQWFISRWNCLVEWLPDSSEKPGDDLVRMVCAGLVANSRNRSLIETQKLIAPKSFK